MSEHNHENDAERPVETEDELTTDESADEPTTGAMGSDDNDASSTDDDTVNADEVEVESDDDRTTNVEGDVNVNVTGQNNDE